MTIAIKDINSWIRERIRPEEIDRYISGDSVFISENEIMGKLISNKNPDPLEVKDILSKSLAIETLEPDETAILLQVKDRSLLDEMEETALRIKQKVYDNRIVTFAPLYMSNLCVNNCLYCGFRKDNRDTKRLILSDEQIKKEVEILAGNIGHKRLIVVYGEHPLTGADYIASSINTIYSVKVKTKHSYGNIRRVNVNAAPMPINELVNIKKAGIGTYQVFQETYHPATYAYLHPKGTIKSDYRWRLYAMHRAFDAGIDDVGIGVLFGLYDWRFEVMGLLYHARELEKRFGIGPHTVSFPRIEPALNMAFEGRERYKVSDEDFRKIITVIRLSIPYTGMIITARETADIRKDALVLGITQTDASTKIGVGSYSENNLDQKEDRQQFLLGDTRSLDEVIREFAESGYITSFCTAGYRCGMTGKCIMELLRTGQEGKFCKLNAVLTFKEWLDDFASEETKLSGEKIIMKEIEEIKKQMPLTFDKLMERYKLIEQGKRDVYF